MSADEWFAASLNDEADFQDWLNARLTENGWLHYHTYDSRRSPTGFPDSHAIHTQMIKLLWAELKMEGKRPRKSQMRWLGALRVIAYAVNRALGREVMIVRLWYPTDRSEILRTIRWRRR